MQQRFALAHASGYDKPMSQDQRRLWGIDLIAGVYALATLALVALYYLGNDATRIFALVVIPITGSLSLGILFRSNIARIALLALIVSPA